MSVNSVMGWLHFLGVVTWVGGMMFQMVSFQPFLKIQDLPTMLPLLFPVIRRFLMMTWSSITLLLISGSDMLIRVLVDQRVSWTSRLGTFLLIKFALVGLMLILFGIIFFRYFFEFRIHYRALLKKPGPQKAAEHYRAIEHILPAMKNLTVANLIVGLVVIFVVEMALNP